MKIKQSFKCDSFVISILLFIIELTSRLLLKYDMLSFSCLRILLSSLIVGIVVSFIIHLFNKRIIANILSIVFITSYSLYAFLQIGFYKFLGVFMSFSNVSQFGAVKDYTKDFLASINGVTYLIFIPVIIYIVYLIIIKTYEKINFNKHLVSMGITFAVIFVIYYLTLILPFMQNKYQSVKNVNLFSAPVSPLTANQLGIGLYGTLDIKNIFFKTKLDYSYNLGDGYEEKNTVLCLKNVPESGYFPFDEITNYFLSKEPDVYNEYTGLFEGKNLIVVYMESVNESILLNDSFNNFNQLYNAGWKFSNYYSPLNSCSTGDNEFSSITSVYPMYNECLYKRYDENTYFQSIYHLFSNKDYSTYFFHDYINRYYKRSVIHTNLGVQNFYDAFRLNIAIDSNYGEWPSDEELMSKVLDTIDFNSKPFMAWITTVSGHHPYSVDSTLGNLYMDEFLKQGYSAAVSRYFSKMKVLDNSIGILIDGLKEKNVLDNTIIVFMGDHYPYAFEDETVASIIGHDTKDREIDKIPFLIYNPAFESKTYDMYTSPVNFAPTMANLFNLTYDSRVFFGNDIFSPRYENVIIFPDGSWKNPNAFFNAETGKIKYYTKNKYSDDYIIDYNKRVNYMIHMSTIAVELNYYTNVEDYVTNCQ